MEPIPYPEPAAASFGRKTPVKRIRERCRWMTDQPSLAGE
jgi:hypothetical protein